MRSPPPLPQRPQPAPRGSSPDRSWACPPLSSSLIRQMPAALHVLRSSTCPPFRGGGTGRAPLEQQTGDHLASLPHFVRLAQFRHVDREAVPLPDEVREGERSLFFAV